MPPSIPCTTCHGTPPTPWGCLRCDDTGLVFALDDHDAAESLYAKAKRLYACVDDTTTQEQDPREYARQVEHAMEALGEALRTAEDFERLQERLWGRWARDWRERERVLLGRLAQMHHDRPIPERHLAFAADHEGVPPEEARRILRHLVAIGKATATGTPPSYSPIV